MKEQTWQERFDKRFVLKKHNDYVDEDSIGEVATGYGYTNEDIKQFISEVETQTREETLKELIREYQDNELDGKGYDFYFSIRAKIEELNKLKK